MKATIFLPDGTRIEAYGTAEEIRRLAEPALVYGSPWQPLWPSEVTPNGTFFLNGESHVPGSVYTISVKGVSDPHAHCATVSASPPIGSGG